VAETGSALAAPRQRKTAPVDESGLDEAVWNSLTGPHSHLAQSLGGATRYPVDVSPFAAVSPTGDLSVWDDLAALVGTGGTAVVIDPTPPQDWETVLTIDGFQMVDVSLSAEDHPEVEPLVTQDVSEMLDLVARTRPGPFMQRTIELGTYLGIRRNGRLVAMAGQRLRLDGWTEISAVCTDPSCRAQGLGSILVRAVAAEIRKRGDIPFLHVAEGNVGAIRLYESLGFEIRRSLSFQLLRATK
jgi:ribosomal protein S18 acetylase RimI-like enzyme